MTVSNTLAYNDTEFIMSANIFYSDPRAFTKLYSGHGLIALNANIRLG
jgi:hypothetical protein